MVIEFHNLEFMQNHVFGFIDLTQADMAAVFERINSQFYLGHIHGNNCGGIKDVPNTIECTYIRKDLVEGVPSVETVPYPIENLDFTPLDIENAQRRNALRLIKRRLVGVLIGKRCKNNVYISDYPLRWWL